MKNKIFAIFGMSTILISCATVEEARIEFPGSRSLASDRFRRRPIVGGEDGVYVAKRIVNNNGVVEVLREFGAMREYDGDRLRAIIVEASPLGAPPGPPGRPGRYNSRGARVNIVMNNQTIAAHEVDARGRSEYLYTAVNRDIGDEVRMLQVHYDPREVAIREVILLVDVMDNARPPGPGPRPPGPPLLHPMAQ
jgi:hypothetical protein